MKLNSAETERLSSKNLLSLTAKILLSVFNSHHVNAVLQSAGIFATKVVSFWKYQVTS
jgi:hypothetical protein